MPRYACKVAYNGQNFHGFARQPTVPTVEGTILSFFLDHQIVLDSTHFRYASRTDKGVSALGNVIVFYTDKPLSQVHKIVNNEALPIKFYDFTVVDEQFHPRHASLRQYRYYLPRHILDQSTLLTLLSLFSGEHDYSNFARIEPGKNPKRSIDNIILTHHNGFYVIDIYAQTFLWHQIRRIIASLIHFARKKITMEDIQQALSHPERSVDFGLAPATPLLLYAIYYPSIFTSVDLPSEIKAFEHLIIQSLSSIQF